MQEKDRFKDLLQGNLEEEMRAVHFSPEARAEVKAKLIASAKTANTTGSSQHSERNASWWDQRIALPRVAFAACIALLLLITGIYTRTFFCVTPQEIADYQADRQIILPRDNTPFGALQMAVVQLPNKGVDGK